MQLNLIAARRRRNGFPMRISAALRTVCWLLPVFAAISLAAQISVSPEGPIRTLREARDTARSWRRDGRKGPITITIHAGTYYLPETLILEPEDSDTIWQAAHGEHPVISGGQLIAGWTKGADKVWSANVPGPYFRQIFVNGKRAVRARTPNYGFFRIDGPSSQDHPFQLHYKGNDVKAEWAQEDDVEVVGFLAWSDFRMPIVSVNPATHTAILASDPNDSSREPDGRYYIENAPDALDTSGEWYYDKTTSRLFYMPMSEEDMNTAQVVVPRLEQLIVMKGTPETGEWVHNVAFRGLTFSHAAWNMDSKGYFDLQAGVPAPSAIEAVGAVNVRFEHCTIAHSGGYGIYFGRGSHQNQVIASEFYDLGGGGVKVGEPTISSSSNDKVYGNTISDNEIHDLGLVYAPAVGVWILQSGYNRVVHNDIHDLFYTGISVGWTWGYGPTEASHNLIAFNDIHAIGKRMLSDMGGIYTLGVQPGTVIRGNLVHDITVFRYGAWGIYPDEGSSDLLIEDNIVYDCQSSGFHQHYGQDNIVRNNIFAFNHDYQLMRTRVEPHISFIFENNIVYFDEGSLLGDNWTGQGYVMKNNVYYDRRGGAMFFAGKSFAEWKAAGHDRGSIIADPLFVNAGNDDFRLQPQSPALRMGFKQIENLHTGTRVPAGADAEP